MGIEGEVEVNVVMPNGGEIQGDVLGGAQFHFWSTTRNGFL